jgi:ribosome maturation factor RimP
MAEDELQALLAAPVAAAGLELVEVERGAGLVRVVVDGPGADLDRIAEVTRAVSAVLDAHDPMPGRYTLEVSTPGIERPLREPRHFQRAVGEDVTVRLVAGVEGDRRVAGRLVAADDAGIVVEGPDVPGGRRRIDYDQVERARTVFVWGAPGAPNGATGRPGRRSGQGRGHASDRETVTRR